MIPANSHMLTDLCVTFALLCSSTTSFSIVMLADTVHSWSPAVAVGIWVMVILSSLYGDSLMELRDGCLCWLSSRPSRTPVTWAQGLSLQGSIASHWNQSASNTSLGQYRMKSHFHWYPFQVLDPIQLHCHIWLLVVSKDFFKYPPKFLLRLFKLFAVYSAVASEHLNILWVELSPCACMGLLWALQLSPILYAG